MQGHWSQYRCPKFQIFKRKNGVGQEVPEDLIFDPFLKCPTCVERRCVDREMPAWSSWRYASSQFKLSVMSP